MTANILKFYLQYLFGKIKGEAFTIGESLEQKIP